MLTVEIKNSQPVELSDLSLSLGAMAAMFKNYANEQGDPAPDNIRLYVVELRSGSIIAQLAALAEQAQFIIDHIDLLAGFYSNLHDVIEYFLGREPRAPAPPSRSDAKAVAQIVEPIAKDNASQLNIIINGPITISLPPPIVITPMEANAIQNRVERYLGPDQLPATFVRTDELMTLEQVKNSPTAKTGDRGIIGAISDRPVKLRFASEEGKRKVLELHENPLQSAFVVDVEVKTIDGKVALYRVLEVKDTLPRP